MWSSKVENFFKVGFKFNKPRIFVFSVFILLLLLILWAAFTELDSVVRAEGRVVPIDKSQLIQHLEGGVVEEIVISEGTIVRKGDLLMQIGDQLGNSGLNEKKIRLVGLRARIERLKAEVSGLNKVIFPSDIAKSEQAGLEMDNFVARKSQTEQEQKVIFQQIAQRKAEIGEQNSRKNELLKESQLAQQKLDLITRLAKENAASQLELLDERQRVQRFRSQIRDSEQAIPKLRSSISEYEERLNEIKNRFRAQALNELSLNKLEADRLSEEIVAGKDRVRRAEIRAPVAGIVNKVFVNTKGGVVRPGETLMEITPIEDKLIVEGKIKPSDRAELIPGLKCRVRLSAYDFGVYGAVPGNLSEISADTLVDERGERFYRVKINLDLSKNPLGGRPILPGMIVTADVVIGKRPLLSVFFSRAFRFSRLAFKELN